MEDLWPASERNTLKIGPREYQLTDLYAFFPSFNLDCSDDSQAHLYPFITNPTGSSFVQFRPGFVDVFLNDGGKICQASNLDAFKEARAGFPCHDGCIGVLHHNGDISVITTAGELLRTYSPPEPLRVLTEYPFPGGVAFTTEGCSFWVFDSATFSWQEFAHGLLPQNVVAVAYAAGRGFVAYGDDQNASATFRGSLARVGPDGFNDFDRLTFHPHLLRCSPRGDLVAAYEPHHLFVRCPTAQIVFEHFEPRVGITSLAFLDQDTYICVSGRSVYVQTRTGLADRWEQKDEFAEPPLVLQGSDCVHVYIDRRAKMLAPLHPSVTQLFAPDTLKRLERLIAAKLEFERRRIESYRILEDIKVYLDRLIFAIIEAVINIPDKKPCEKLLSHAAFAKYQLPKFPHNDFANALRDLQVLNTLRSTEHGWIITGSAFLELTKEKEDRQRLILNVIQLQNSTTRSSTALELAHVLCHLYGINPSIVAENWAARMLKLHQAAAVDGVLRKIKPYDSVDYVRLAVAAKKYAIENSEVNKIVKCARDPKVRMIYILTELGNDVEAMQDVLQSMDGNALVSYLVLCKYKLPAETFGLRLAQNTIIADQYAAYRQYIQYASILQIEGYPPLRAAALELLHSGDIAFGKDTQRLSEVARRLEQVEKKSPLLLAVQHQQTVIGAMQAVTSGQGFSPKPATSARFLVMQALMDGRGSLVDSLLKPYKVSDKTFAWIQIQTFSAKKDWKRFADLAKKSSPLSWDVYSDVCHANGRREEAVAFVRKISSAEQRLALFEQYEYWREAAGAASELKSPRWAELNAKAKAEDDND